MVMKGRCELGRREGWRRDHNPALALPGLQTDGVSRILWYMTVTRLHTNLYQEICLFSLHVVVVTLVVLRIYLAFAKHFHLNYHSQILECLCISRLYSSINTTFCISHRIHPLHGTVCSRRSNLQLHRLLQELINYHFLQTTIEDDNFSCKNFLNYICLPIRAAD